MFEGLVVIALQIVLVMLLARAWSPRFSQAWTWPKFTGHYIGFNRKSAAPCASNDHSADSGDGWSWGNDRGLCINPATGLPMTSGSPIGFDTQGNRYGFSNQETSAPLIETEMSSVHWPIWEDTEPSWHTHEINPATGLPMVSDSIGGVDIGGNQYGCSSTWPDP